MHELSLPDGRRLVLDRPLIVGILNVTPDSFSDGGRHDGRSAAVEHASQMLAQGADVIDVGGESTRPGAQRIDAREQQRRTVGVIADLRARHPQAIISIDTTLSDVAEAALDAGAAILNDVSAGREDPRMFGLAARRGAPIVLMHMKGQPANMQKGPHYDDVVAEVKAFLLERANAAINAGVPRSQIVLDPGIGFGKTREHNLALLAHLHELVQTGFPVLLGTSRKRFMGAICTMPGCDPPAPGELIGATCATTALGVAAGASMFRVHDVQANRQAAQVAFALLQTAR